MRNPDTQGKGHEGWTEAEKNCKFIVNRKRETNNDARAGETHTYIYTQRCIDTRGGVTRVECGDDVQEGRRKDGKKREGRVGGRGDGERWQYMGWWSGVCGVWV